MSSYRCLIPGAPPPERGEAESVIHGRPLGFRGATSSEGTSHLCMCTLRDRSVLRDIGLGESQAGRPAGVQTVVFLGATERVNSQFFMRRVDEGRADTRSSTHGLHNMRIVTSQARPLLTILRSPSVAPFGLSPGRAGERCGPLRPSMPGSRDESGCCKHQPAAADQ